MTPPIHSTARIIEVFSSIQGEGIYVGQPHLFVRFWDCNLSCAYCDTDYRGPYREATSDELLEQVKRLLQQEGPFHAVSLTGGEPLLWWRFLKDWLPQLKALGQKTYLETNGTLPTALSQILPWVDIIAMDIKPPSATGDRALWREHETFLRVAQSSPRPPKLFVKIVVTRDTSDDDLQRSFDLVSQADRAIPVVLQPVTPWGPVTEGPLAEQLERWRCRAKEQLSDVRVIPQVHRMIGVP